MKYYKKLMLLFLVIMLLISLSGCFYIPDLAKSKNTDTQLTTKETNTTIKETTSSTDKTTTGENGQPQDSKAPGYNNNFILKDINGKDVSLSDFAGNIVVLNFWATWCPPCKAEIPDFIEVFNSYKDKGVSFIGVSLDEDFNELVNFVSEYKINYTIVQDVSSVNISDGWGIEAIPTTFFLDEKGNVLDSVVGQMPKDNLISKIEAFLSRNRT
jgi:thiol-disulfide isomerase/thioredoxin